MKSNGVLSLLLQFHNSLQLSGQYDGWADISILDKFGRILNADKATIVSGSFHLSKSLDLPSGFYVVRIALPDYTYQEKLAIQRN